jgi:Tfp pilus assembly protein PilX
MSEKSMMIRISFSRAKQRGATLFVGLMFLLVLTLVALISMQGTTLEVKMATNQTQQKAAFQLAESMRLMTGEITSQNTLNRGMTNFTGNSLAWANTSGTGTVGGQPGGGATCSSGALSATQQLYQNDATSTYSQTWHTIAGVFQGNIPTTTTTNIAGNPDKLLADCTGTATGTSAWASVYAIGTRGTPGTGTAQNESATGVGASGGGATKWFEIRSQGQVGGGAVAITAAEYRQPIVN